MTLLTCLVADSHTAQPGGGLAQVDLGEPGEVGVDRHHAAVPGIGQRGHHGEAARARPSSPRRYYIPPDAAPTAAALLAFRDHVIAPVIVGVRSPPHGP